MVTANERVRNDTVKLVDILLCPDPLAFLTGGVPILGNITETEYVGNLLAVLVFNDPIVYALKLFGLIFGEPLSIAYYRE